MRSRLSEKGYQAVLREKSHTFTAGVFAIAILAASFVAFALDWLLTEIGIPRLFSLLLGIMLSGCVLYPVVSKIMDTAGVGIMRFILFVAQYSSAALAAIFLAFLIYWGWGWNFLICLIVVGGLFTAILYYVLNRFFVTSVQNKITRETLTVLALIIAASVSGYLAALSLVYTVKNSWDVVDGEPVVSVFLTIIVATITLVFFVLVLRFVPSTDEMRKLVARIAVTFVGFCGLVYISLLNGKIYYVSDSQTVIEQAAGLEETNFYIEWYPHQVGYEIFLKGIFKVFGQWNLLPVFLINILASCIVLYISQSIAKTIFGSNKVAIATVLLFIPFTFLIYTAPFIYGDVIGLALALIGVLIVARHVRSQINPWMLCIAVACFVLSVVAKGSLNLITVGALAFSIVYWIATRKRLLLVATGTATIFVLLIPNLLAQVYAEKYDLDLSATTPRTTWIAMGLMSGWAPDGNYVESTLPKDLHSVNAVAPGAFNGYAWYSRTDNIGASKQYLADMANEHIRRSVHSLLEDPEYAMAFFLMKNAYTWAEPTFSTHTGIEEPERKTVIVTQFARINVDDATGALLFLTDRDSPLRSVMLVLGDAVQLLVYGFAAVGFAISARRNTMVPLAALLGLVFLAGFTMYTFWEAMPRFGFPFYAMLVPVAGYGLVTTLDALRARRSPGAAHSLQNTAGL